MSATAEVKPPFLILIRGLPGSGKSYLARALADSYGSENVYISDPDTIDYSSDEYKKLVEALTKEGVEEKFFPNRYLKYKCHTAIDAGKVIIWNQAFTLLDGFQRTVTNLVEHANNTGIQLPILVVEVEVDHDIAKKRIEDRVSKGGHNVPEEAFQRFVNDYKSFEGLGYEVVRVRGEDDTKVSVDKVKFALSGL